MSNQITTFDEDNIAVYSRHDGVVVLAFFEKRVDPETGEHDVNGKQTGQVSLGVKTAIELGALLNVHGQGIMKQVEAVKEQKKKKAEEDQEAQDRELREKADTWLDSLGNVWYGRDDGKVYRESHPDVFKNFTDVDEIVGPLEPVLPDEDDEDEDDSPWL